MIQTSENNSQYIKNKNLDGLLDMDPSLAEKQIKSEIQSAEVTIQQLKSQGAKLQIQIDELSQELKDQKEHTLVQNQSKAKMDASEQDRILRSLQNEHRNAIQQLNLYQKEYDKIIENQKQDQHQGGIMARLQKTEEELKKCEEEIEKTKKLNSQQKQENFRNEREVNNLKADSHKAEKLNALRQQLILLIDRLVKMQETYQKNEKTHQIKLEKLQLIKNKLDTFLMIDKKEWPVVKDIFDQDKVRQHQLKIQANNESNWNEEVFGRHNSVDKKSLAKFEKLMPLSNKSVDEELSQVAKEKWQLSSQSVKESRNTEDNFEKLQENLTNYIELAGSKQMLEDAQKNLDRAHEQIVDDYREQQKRYADLQQKLDKDLKTKIKEKELAQNMTNEMKKHVRFNSVQPLQDPNQRLDTYEIVLLCDKRRTKRVVQGKKPTPHILHCDDIDIIGRDNQTQSIQKIMFYYNEEDRKILGAQVTYKIGERSIEGQQHVNVLLKNKSKKINFEIDENDQIHKVSGTIRDNIEYLSFRTSKNQFFQIGEKQPKSLQFNFQFREKQVPIAFFCGLDLTSESFTPNELMMVYIGFEIKNTILQLEQLPFNELRNEIQKNISQVNSDSEQKKQVKFQSTGQNQSNPSSSQSQDNQIEETKISTSTDQQTDKNQIQRGNSQQDQTSNQQSSNNKEEKSPEQKQSSIAKVENSPDQQSQSTEVQNKDTIQEPTNLKNQQKINENAKNEDQKINEQGKDQKKQVSPEPEQQTEITQNDDQQQQSFSEGGTQSSNDQKENTTQNSNQNNKNIDKIPEHQQQTKNKIDSTQKADEQVESVNQPQQQKETTVVQNPNDVNINQKDQGTEKPENQDIKPETNKDDTSQTNPGTSHQGNFKTFDPIEEIENEDDQEFKQKAKKQKKQKVESGNNILEDKQGENKTSENGDYPEGTEKGANDENDGLGIPSQKKKQKKQKKPVQSGVGGEAED